MMLPHTVRADLLECVGATGMPSRQIENLVDQFMRDLKERRVAEISDGELQ
jgi:hypothetical protein